MAREAWQITQFSHYTAVSRALKACSGETVDQVVAVLDEVSRPFIEQEVAGLVTAMERWVLHADLSGRRVSAYSQSYPEAHWGYMGHGLALGHQHALITMEGRSYRLCLAGFPHPGDTVSEVCLRQLIQAAEQRLSCRPRRALNWCKGVWRTWDSSSSAIVPTCGDMNKPTSKNRSAEMICRSGWRRTRSI